ncbi:MAG: sigma54 specific transcriptional regulator, Fis family [Bryobacterales bacterium]|nr:sigma54 specific transcriptional regulator, Fis family [Bryobacterales bacterium]
MVPHTCRSTARRRRQPRQVVWKQYRHRRSKRGEKKLLEEERELRRITDAIPQTILLQDPSGHPLYANQAALDYTGLTMQDVVTSDFRARIFHPEDLERLREDRQAALALGLPFEIEQRARWKDGQYRWFLIRYNPFRDEQGRLVRWYATGTDIDDRKRAEDRTRNENVALREDIVRSSMFEEKSVPPSHCVK